MEKYTIETCMEDGEINTQVHKGDVPIDPSSLRPPYDSIIRIHQEVIREAHLEEKITTTFDAP